MENWFLTFPCVIGVSAGPIKHMVHDFESGCLVSQGESFTYHWETITENLLCLC